MGGIWGEVERGKGERGRGREGEKERGREGERERGREGERERGGEGERGEMEVVGELGWGMGVPGVGVCLWGGGGEGGEMRKSKG